MELFTFLRITDGDTARLTCVPIGPEHEGTTTDSQRLHAQQASIEAFRTFSCESAQCYDPNDKEHLLGVIEQGQTAHGRVMGQAVINAVLKLQLDLMKPIGVGILGPEIQPDQIQERLVPYARDAVLAVHTMLGSSSNSI